ncbi:unnamed protein product [Moneuplotes crassus]|uniref:Uncharacterized protein n=1 Tax=Euplotes crassus TaxID=5936 RepID=A0AAD1TYM7_EUPCR|nr:unnamed protein product [Moneuplotes crassus]
MEKWEMELYRKEQRLDNLQYHKLARISNEVKRDLDWRREVVYSGCSADSLKILKGIRKMRVIAKGQIKKTWIMTNRSDNKVRNYSKNIPILRAQQTKISGFSTLSKNDFISNYKFKSIISHTIAKIEIMAFYFTPKTFLTLFTCGYSIPHIKISFSFIQAFTPSLSPHIPSKTTHLELLGNTLPFRVDSSPEFPFKYNSTCFFLYLVSTSTLRFSLEEVKFVARASEEDNLESYIEMYGVQDLNVIESEI